MVALRHLGRRRRRCGGSAPATVDLSAQHAGPFAACGGAHGTIAIELTLDEIVDVAVSHAGAQQHCLEDAVWNTLVALPDPAPRSHALLVL